jgi:DNA repair photolyase
MSINIKKGFTNEVTIRETEAKSILRKHKKIDSWFLSAYGMNLYRGCFHNCAYCDGRAEGYYVEGEFGEDVVVKTNAIEILKRELDPARKRVPFKKGYILVGGGVCDTYQSAEKKYQLTRQTLELILKYKFPAHILTKSILIKRDINLIKQIHKQNRAIVSFSFSSVDDKISSIFEPGVPSATKRLETLKILKEEGIPCGMFLMPIIPFVTDNPELMEQSVARAREIDLDFIIFGGMTLKPGRQKEYFLDGLKKFNPKLVFDYDLIYTDNKWGQAKGEYYDSLNFIFRKIAQKFNIPVRIPFRLFEGLLTGNDHVIVLLEHIDFHLKMKGSSSPFGFAAYSISKLKQPLSTMRGNLTSIKGVGKTTEKVIIEILETGSSRLYEKLIIGQNYSK